MTVETSTDGASTLLCLNIYAWPKLWYSLAQSLNPDPARIRFRIRVVMVKNRVTISSGLQLFGPGQILGTTK